MSSKHRMICPISRPQVDGNGQSAVTVVAEVKLGGKKLLKAKKFLLLRQDGLTIRTSFGYKVVGSRSKRRGEFLGELRL
jgi:hypothetical protein